MQAASLQKGAYRVMVIKWLLPSHLTQELSQAVTLLMSPGAWPMLVPESLFSSSITQGESLIKVRGLCCYIQKNEGGD